MAMSPYPAGIDPEAPSINRISRRVRYAVPPLEIVCGKTHISTLTVCLIALGDPELVRHRREGHGAGYRSPVVVAYVLAVVFSGPPAKVSELG